MCLIPQFDTQLCSLVCVWWFHCTGNYMFLLVVVVLVVTGMAPLVRRRVWRSQCCAMTCQRWVWRLGVGGWLVGAGLVGHVNPPAASSPLSCCGGKREQQHTVNINMWCTSWVFFFTYGSVTGCCGLGMGSVPRGGAAGVLGGLPGGFAGLVTTCGDTCVRPALIGAPCFKLVLPTSL